MACNLIYDKNGKYPNPMFFLFENIYNIIEK
jgi:hypothetical protein